MYFLLLVSKLKLVQQKIGKTNIEDGSKFLDEVEIQKRNVIGGLASNAGTIIALIA